MAAILLDGIWTGLADGLRIIGLSFTHVSIGVELLVHHLIVLVATRVTVTECTIGILSFQACASRLQARNDILRISTVPTNGQLAAPPLFFELIIR